MKRREFLQTAAGAAIVAHSWAGNVRARTSRINPRDISYEPNEQLTSTGLSIKDGCEILKKGEENNTAPVLCEEILENPNAVFIIYAGVKNSKDAKGKWKHCHEQMENFGRRVAELVFRKGTVKGGRTFIKPNLVGGISGSDPTYINGNVVHPYFTVGLVDVLHDLGNTNVATGARGALRHNHVVESGLGDLFDAHNLPLFEAHYQWFSDYNESELVWHKNPDGMVVRNFCTYKPVFEEGTTFINIAHAHTHKVGHTTLTLKNLQGVMPRVYGHVCDSWTTMGIWRSDVMDDFNADYRAAVEESYYRHGNMGYQFWDDGVFVKSYQDQGGYDVFMRTLDDYQKKEGQEREVALDKLYDIAESRIFWAEQWAQRMMDMVEALPTPYVSMVEGVFARGDSAGIEFTDFLTVGHSMVSVDAVTSWLMGQDPRGLPYLRIANERSLGENDVSKIPIFILDENGPRRVIDYNSLKRNYMGINNYSLGNKRYFKEPVITLVERQERSPVPEFFITARCYPNPFNLSTTIHFEMSHSGKVVISIYTVNGQRIRTYNVGEYERGTHKILFDATELAAGQYLYRIDAGYADFSGKMLLMK